MTPKPDWWPKNPYYHHPHALWLVWEESSDAIWEAMPPWFQQFTSGDIPKGITKATLTYEYLPPKLTPDP